VTPNPSAVAACLSAVAAKNCYVCPEERACVMIDPGSETWWCESRELAALFEKNDGRARLRFTDYSTWSNAPIDSSGPCPNMPGVALCGGTCGICAPGGTCTGRSPLHPFGVCVQGTPDNCNGTIRCRSGEKCFRFTVQADAQPLADARAYCMQKAECEALATGLPGGATCTETP
jgi:hypothetical protein